MSCPLHLVCYKLMPPQRGAVKLFATRGAVESKKKHIQILFEGELVCTDHEESDESHIPVWISVSVKCDILDACFCYNVKVSEIKII